MINFNCFLYVLTLSKALNYSLDFVDTCENSLCLKMVPHIQIQFARVCIANTFYLLFRRQFRNILMNNSKFSFSYESRINTQSYHYIKSRCNQKTRQKEKRRNT